MKLDEFIKKLEELKIQYSLSDDTEVYVRFSDLDSCNDWESYMSKNVDIWYLEKFNEINIEGKEE